jgi:hypothetical protein
MSSPDGPLAAENDDEDEDADAAVDADVDADVVNADVVDVA